MEYESQKGYKILNKDVIKYVAMFTMLLNHISAVFMDQNSFWGLLFRDAGYFTAITMCYFLVEGYQYTRSKKAYAKRLALFALLSEIPFCLTFTKNGIISFYGMNMLFTLLLCFFILLTHEKVKYTAVRGLIYTGIMILSTISDWPWYAPMFTLLFIWSKNSKKKLAISYAIAAVSFGFFMFLEGIMTRSFGNSILFAICGTLGIIVSGIVIIFFYNGKRMEKGKTFSKWFFYAFYPLHLLILGVLRIVLL